MAWYEEAVFYHIYPLGLTGAPKRNQGGPVEHRLLTLIPWLDHMVEIGCSALYIGPLFESVGHGYETTDYRKVDRRLGTNEDLALFVRECHSRGIRVILDAVFNHTGREFFAFQDLKKNREASRYRDWYRNVDFSGNNEYGDGFSYENWGGYNLLPKLNQCNPEVVRYHKETVQFWVDTFAIDGLRLDAANVLDFGFMHELRMQADQIRPDFWLMGEVIGGEYIRWANPEHLHAVTNFVLHKALYSAHNDHNYFEIAHNVKRLYDMGGSRTAGLGLYNFSDNHDFNRIMSMLHNQAHYTPVQILVYTLPGVPAVYYGTEFGLEGCKGPDSDDALRPALNLSDYADAVRENPCTALIAALGRIRRQNRALSYGEYQELYLTNRQYAFARYLDGEAVLVTVNNDDAPAEINVPDLGFGRYRGALWGTAAGSEQGRLCLTVPGNSGEIWLPEV